MLNKPTNVSPYNTFIDINDGLELKFKLNNSVNRTVIDIYSKSNELVYSNTFQIDKTERDFSIPIPNAISLLKNGDDYYWEMEYSSAKEVDTTTHPINGWNSSANMLGVFCHTEFFIVDESGEKNFLNLGKITKIKPLDNYDTFFTFEAILSDEEQSMLKKQIRNNSTYLYFYKDNFVAWAHPIGIDQEFLSDNVRLKCRNISANGRLYRYMQYEDIESELRECDVKILVLNEDAISVGDTISLIYNNNEYIYTVTDMSYSSDETNYIPSNWVTLDSSLPDLGETDVIGKIRDDVIIMVKQVEYSKSPSYYFSCRDKIDVSLMVEDGFSPQIKICAAFQKYPSVNYYRYQVYKLKSRSNWESTWKSDKLIDFDTIDGTRFHSQIVYYKGVLPNTTYKIKLVGQTQEGMDFEAEEIITTEDFLSNTTQTVPCVKFDDKFGCVNIDISQFKSSSRENSLHVFRYNTLKHEIDFVLSTDFAVNSVSSDDGLFRKVTVAHDFNIICNAEYVYYFYELDKDGSVVCSYKSDSITPSWYGVYLTDLKFIDNKQYKPDKDNTWFVQLNYEPSDISRNYQVAHPIAINQKYPKSVRGKARFKTGSVSGLIGGISRSDDYIENVFDVDNFDDFCANGNLKLLRSSTKGECLICDIDSFASSVFGYDATMIQVSYTQIDDITGKQISAEV